MSTEISTERTKTPRDPGVIHLVPLHAVGNRIARCGFDCSDRTAKPVGTANCVVCLDLYRNR